MQWSLKRYGTKRDFARNREPESALRKRKLAILRKHDGPAFSRTAGLELARPLRAGFPKAQSDPKGLRSMSDHTLDYFAFEGTIPKANEGTPCR